MPPAMPSRRTVAIGCARRAPPRSSNSARRDRQRSGIGVAPGHRPAPSRSSASRSSPATGSSARSPLENHERENAFGESDVRLLHDGRREHGRRAGERAPLRRDAAPAEGDRAARRRARGDQQHAAGLAARARLPGHRRPGRRQAPRDLRTPRTSASGWLRRADQPDPLPVRVRARAAVRRSRRRRSPTEFAAHVIARARPSWSTTTWPQAIAKFGQHRHARHATEKSCVVRADRRRRPGARADRPRELRARERVRRIRRAPAADAAPTAWASRWRTRASSTRRSAC